MFTKTDQTVTDSFGKMNIQDDIQTMFDNRVLTPVTNVVNETTPEDVMIKFEKDIQSMYTFLISFKDASWIADFFIDLINKKNKNNLFPEFIDVHGTYKGSDYTGSVYNVYVYDKDQVIWLKMAQTAFADEICKYMSNLLLIFNKLLNGTYEKIIIGLKTNNNDKYDAKINFINANTHKQNLYTGAAVSTIAQKVAMRLSKVNDDFEALLGSKTDLLPVCWTAKPVGDQHYVYEFKTGKQRLRIREDYFTEYINMCEITDDDRKLIEGFLRDITTVAKQNDDGTYLVVNTEMIEGNDYTKMNPDGTWKVKKSKKTVGVKDEEKSEMLYQFLKVVCGYLITGEISLQLFFVLIGDGANGKSGLYRLLRKALKGYAGLIPSASLCGKTTAGDAASPSIMEAENRRLLIASELSKTDVLCEGKIKPMTGDGDLQGRKLNQGLHEFIMRAKLLIGSNEMPAMNINSYAMIRRLIMIPFNSCFDESYERYFEGNKYHVPIIEGMNDKIVEPGPLSAFVEWCALGAYTYYTMQDCKRYFKDMNKMFGATEVYLSENDTIKQFVEEECETVLDKINEMNEQYETDKVKVPQPVLFEVTEEFRKNLMEEYFVVKPQLFEVYSKSKIQGVKYTKATDFYAAIKKRYGLPDDNNKKGGKRFKGIRLINSTNDTLMF